MESFHWCKLSLIADPDCSAQRVWVEALSSISEYAIELEMAGTKICRGIRTFASSSIDGLLGSAVHIRIFPRPRNLGESREILRILEKFGEIVMFKHLKVSALISYIIRY